MKPTKEQEQKFWKWCGIKYMKHQGQEGWVRPDIDFAFSSPPDIDLNNLFKYALDPLYRRENGYKLEIILQTWIRKILTDEESYKKSALTLFWIIWEMIDD